MYIYLHLSIYFPVIILRIDFVLYSPILVNSYDVQLGHKRVLLIYVQIFNRTIAEKYINISEKDIMK